ncbi:MAG: hypothetical protein MUF15_16945 [Acidobacteria bacterium]|jgi:hypothetical protein|nr:hypothetical protein [Acidobacteriota bacterium]
MKKNTLLLLILISFLICCKTNKKPEIKPDILAEKTSPVNVVFQQVSRLDLPDLVYPYILATDDELYIYGQLLNKKETSFKKFDNHFQLVFEKKFPWGEGPGDLGDGAFFSKSGDTFYAFVNFQQRINVFNKNLEFERFLRTKQKFQSPLLCEDGKNFIAGIYKMESYNLRHMSGADIVAVSFPGLDKQLLHKFPMALKVETKNGQKFSYTGNYHQYDYFARQENVYILDMKEYILYRFHLDGTLVHAVRVDVDKIPVPDSKREQWTKEHYGDYQRSSVKFVFTDYVLPTSWMVPLGKGFAVIRRYGYSRQCNGMVEADYFNYNLEMLGKIKIPCFDRIYDLDLYVLPRTAAYRGGYLYMVNKDIDKIDDELYFLEKWQVQE